MLNGFISPFKIIPHESLHLPKGKWCVLYDKKTDFFIKKIKGDVVFTLSVQGGEEAKSSASFLKLLDKISQKENQTQKIDGFCVVGGGSVGDLGAFISSVYRRGVRLVLVPSTYLAAIDSAFGGKTALNLSGAKNQIGTFYPAENVFLVKKLIAKSKKNLKDSFAEILKMALLERGLWGRLGRRPLPNDKTFWKLAAPSIREKLKVVKADPYEKKGLRRILNLGHTFGHVFEKLSPLTHGEAVALGLLFELEYFYVTQRLKTSDYLHILEKWESLFDANELLKKLGRKHSSSKVRLLLTKDKKGTSKTISMPVVSAPGKFKLSDEPQELLLHFLKVYGVTR